MYNDDKVWGEHYKDWLQVLENMTFTGEGDVKPTQFDYRRNLVRKLLSDYERSHK